MGNQQNKVLKIPMNTQDLPTLIQNDLDEFSINSELKTITDELKPNLKFI